MGPRKDSTADSGGARYYIAVPTFKRAADIEGKTLSLLERQGVPRQHVFIFVASGEERAVYAARLGERWRIVVGEPTLWRQRNFITRFFPEGSHVVSLDDDVEEIYRLHGEATNGGSLEPLHKGGLVDIIKDAWKKMHAFGSHLWSLNVSDNPYFMKRGVVTLRHGLCNGFFWGCKVRHDESLLLQYGDGHEDVERTVRFFSADGAVLRFREFCAKTRCKVNKGGLQSSMSNAARKAAEEDGVRKLVEEFPCLLEAKAGKILGLKFRSGVSSIIRKFHCLGTTQLQGLVARSSMHLLEGARWAGLGNVGEHAGDGSDDDRRLLAGCVESVRQDLGVMCLRCNDGTPLVASDVSFNKALSQEQVAIVWLPEGACEELGTSCRPIEELPVYLRGEPLAQLHQRHSADVVSKRAPKAARTKAEACSEFAQYLAQMQCSSFDERDADGSSDGEDLPSWKTSASADEGCDAKKTPRRKRKLSKSSTQCEDRVLAPTPAGGKVPKACLKRASRFEDAAWIQGQRAAELKAGAHAAGAAQGAGEVDAFRAWRIDGDFDVVLKKLCKSWRGRDAGKPQAAACVSTALVVHQPPEPVRKSRVVDANCTMESAEGSSCAVQPFFCMSRIWGGGWGGQCTRPRPGDNEYCVLHRKELARQGYLTHGRIDGPIPPKKRLEFAKWQKILHERYGSMEAHMLGAGSSLSTMTDAGAGFSVEGWRSMGRGAGESKRAYEYRTQTRLLALEDATAPPAKAPRKSTGRGRGQLKAHEACNGQ